MKLDEVLKSEGLTCAIPYADISGVLEAISESMTDGQERAITFCGDGQELSFPQAVGWEFAIAPEECPPGKETLGDFHTHIPEEEVEHLPPRHSIWDLEDDLRKRCKVSCVGAPQLVLENNGVYWQRNIVCQRFDTEHPEYEDFRERFLPVVSEAGNYYDLLSMELDLEAREATPEESAEYKEYENKVNALMEEAKSKGIIKSCAPFSMPDVQRMLTEQKPPEVKPPAVPVPVLRVKTEQLVFAESVFTRYTNLDTGKVRIERVY